MPAAFLFFIAKLLLISALGLSSAYARELLIPPGSLVASDHPEAITQQSALEFFPSEIKIQEGSTCHIYATIALVEAFCKRNAGYEVDLSESYLYYLHLSQLLREQNGQIKVNPFGDADLSRTEEGDPKLSFQRIKKGLLCRKDEFLFRAIESFIQSVQAFVRRFHEETLGPMVEALKEEPNGAEDPVAKAFEERKQAFPKELARYLDGLVEKALPAGSFEVKEDGLHFYTQDKKLKGCLEQIQDFPELIAPSKEQMMRILDSGNAFLCVLEKVDNLSIAFPALRSYLGSNERLRHSTLVYGYRKLKGSRRVEFLVRDSNFIWPNPYSVTGCNRIYYLRPKKEEAWLAGLDPQTSP